MRKIIFVLLIAQTCCLVAFPQYWQQQVNYSIDVSLNDKEHTLDGFERIEYINNSPDTLFFIWFHLWPNAYKNDKTAFSDQALENGSTKFYFSDKEKRGYINRLDFKVDDISANLEDHPQHIDIVKLILPTPLPPGKKTIITTPFHIKLPYNFSRSGHDGQSYQVTQWYPKPAVYDHKGWHPIPYLDQGEFYSEFGSFDVSISVPKNYVVAATGELQNKDELEWLKSRSDFSWEPLTEKIKNKSGQIQNITQQFPVSASEIKRINFKQDNIHDFAWFADKRFIVKHDTCNISTGKLIDVFSYFTPSQKEYWKNSVQVIKETIRTRSEWIGEYPYRIVSAVQGPESFGGGMEYPTITIISPSSEIKLLEFTLAHEVSHNWFYSILATNERKHPWMDEGMNTYYDNRHSQWKYGDQGEISFGKTNITIREIEKLGFETLSKVKKDQPINTVSQDFTSLNYNLIAYFKTGEWMELVEKKIGKETFDKAMQEYFRQWKFKHPYPEDFKKVLESESGKSLDEEFSLLDKKGSIDQTNYGGFNTTTLFSKGFIKAHIKSVKNLLTWSPVFGVNSYDKFMLGGFFTNYKLPPNNFQFLIVPLYSTGAKKLNGLGRLSYNWYPEKSRLRKISLFTDVAKFSIDEYEKDDGKKVYNGFTKFVPGIRLTFKDKNPRNSISKYIQWKSFFIREGNFRISFDSVFTGNDTIIQQVVKTIGKSRALQQFKFKIENYRALYPFSAELNLEHATDFVRAAFTGNYFFNYPKEGGLHVRLFAGKFFYLGSKTFTKQFATDQYHLNMTGPNGYEDYTYSDYFIGRNRFNNFASQQIMVRDGGFKVRTDLYANKVGKTDDWLAAVNLTTLIPSSINPLSMLPVKIPVKIFADIGTYGDAWRKDAELDRFIFDAGFQVSLFANTLNIYIPVLYSNVYKDYIQSVFEKKKRLLKTISFSIDISNFNLKKINREFDF